MKGNPGRHQTPFEAAPREMDQRESEHGHMARGGYGLPKVSLRPVMPYRSTACGRAIPETALQPFQGWPARRVACQQGGQRAAVFSPFGHPMLCTYGGNRTEPGRNQRHRKTPGSGGHGGNHRCMLWSVEGSRRWPEATHSTDTPELAIRPFQG
jgi:hypothetical protein